MTTAWVIGRGGLLGSSIDEALGRAGVASFRPADRLPWHDLAGLAATVERQVHAFASAVPRGAAWRIYWAAGVGTMGSRADAFAAEACALDALFAALSAALERSSLEAGAGRIAYASSAGAIYAGSSAPSIDERCAVAPTTPYAFAKLEQEARVVRFVERSGVRALIARISTLYGTGQASSKQQGLLTHIARCVVRHRPIQIFVPLDTIRDYLAADDAASMTLEALDAIGPGTTVKIVASEQPTTIAEIVTLFRRVARRAPRVVTGVTSQSAVYARRIAFRSVVPPLRGRRATPLLIGVGALLANERLRYAAHPVDGTPRGATR